MAKKTENKYVYTVDMGKATDKEATSTLYFATPKAVFDWVTGQQHDKYTLKETVGKKKLQNITLTEKSLDELLEEDSVCLTLSQAYDVEAWYNINKEPLRV